MHCFRCYFQRYNVSDCGPKLTMFVFKSWPQMDNGRKLLVYTSHPGTEKQENLSVLLLDIESHNLSLDIHTISLLFSSMNEPSAPRHLSYIKASLLVIKLFGWHIFRHNLNRRKNLNQFQRKKCFALPKGIVQVLHKLKHIQEEFFF